MNLNLERKNMKQYISEEVFWRQLQKQLSPQDLAQAHLLPRRNNLFLSDRTKSQSA